MPGTVPTAFHTLSHTTEAASRGRETLGSDPSPAVAVTSSDLLNVSELPTSHLCSRASDGPAPEGSTRAEGVNVCEALGINHGEGAASFDLASFHPQ